MIDLFTRGPGPFITPLCSEVVSLDDHCHPEAFVLRFRLEDGAELHIPIARHQLHTLSELLAVQCVRTAEKPHDLSEH